MLEETVIKIGKDSKMVEVDLEDNSLDEVELDEGTHLDYQIWLLGRGEHGDVTDFEYLIDNYDTEEEAYKCAEFFKEHNLNVIKNKDSEFFIPADVWEVDVVVETILVDDVTHEDIEFIDSDKVCTKEVKSRIGDIDTYNEWVYKSDSFVEKK